MSGWLTNGATQLSVSDLTGSEQASYDTELANGQNPQTAAISLNVSSTWIKNATGFTAQADGTKANATVLGYGLSNVTTVAGAADSVLLPAAVAGAICILVNNGANAMQVFGQGTDTINGVATATGVSQTNALTALYVCTVDGAWMRLLSA